MPMRELRVEDALLYLDQVKVEFGDRPHIYNEFLDIMKTFKTQQIDTPGVIRRVSNLFQGNRRLVLGFNTFLPEGYRIELPDGDGPPVAVFRAPGEVAVRHDLSGPNVPPIRQQQRPHEPQPQQGVPPEVALALGRTGGMQGTPGQQQQQGHVVPPGFEVMMGGRVGPVGPPPQQQHHHKHNGVMMDRMVGGVSGLANEVVLHAQQMGDPRGQQQQQQQQQQQLGQHHAMGGGPTRGRPAETPQSHGHIGMPQQPQSQPGRSGMVMGQGNSQPSQHVIAQQQQQQQQMIGGTNNSTSTSTQNKQPSVANNGGAPPHQQQQQSPGVGQPLEFDHAINYVTTIKKRFADEPETYKKFLEILHTYQKEQRGIKEVLEEVSVLFEEHPDLLKEFTFFLLDAVQSEAKQQLEIVVKEAEERRAQKLAAAKQTAPQPKQRKQYVAPTPAPPPPVEIRPPSTSIAFGATAPRSVEREKEIHRSTVYGTVSFGPPRPPRKNVIIPPRDSIFEVNITSKRIRKKYKKRKKTKNTLAISSSTATAKVATTITAVAVAIDNNDNNNNSTNNNCDEGGDDDDDGNSILCTIGEEEKEDDIDVLNDYANADCSVWLDGSNNDKAGIYTKTQRHHNQNQYQNNGATGNSSSTTMVSATGTASSRQLMTDDIAEKIFDGTAATTTATTLSYCQSDINQSRRKCVPLKPPIPTKFQGDMDKFQTASVPEFTSLVNFPVHMSQKQLVINLPKRMRCCVMCGSACPCSGRKKKGGCSIGGRKDSPSGNNSHAIIPIQNKGLCTLCDVNVWIVSNSGLEIKWCKGCKNFRTWAAFGDKGLATKCLRCRERYREKYVFKKQKEDKDSHDSIAIQLVNPLLEKKRKAIQCSSSSTKKKKKTKNAPSSSFISATSEAATAVANNNNNNANSNRDQKVEKFLDDIFSTLLTASLSSLSSSLSSVVVEEKDDSTAGGVAVANNIITPPDSIIFEVDITTEKLGLLLKEENTTTSDLTTTYRIYVAGVKNNSSHNNNSNSNSNNNTIRIGDTLLSVCGIEFDNLTDAAQKIRDTVRPFTLQLQRTTVQPTTATSIIDSKRLQQQYHHHDGARFGTNVHYNNWRNLKDIVKNNFKQFNQATTRQEQIAFVSQIVEAAMGSSNNNSNTNRRRYIDNDNKNDFNTARDLLLQVFLSAQEAYQMQEAYRQEQQQQYQQQYQPQQQNAGPHPHPSPNFALGYNSNSKTRSYTLNNKDLYNKENIENGINDDDQQDDGNNTNYNYDDERNGNN